jgi:hypothetical protein
MRLDPGALFRVGAGGVKAAFSSGAAGDLSSLGFLFSATEIDGSIF